jgi:stress response protein YsnF
MMIIPITEEVLVVERRLMLKEELHVRRKRTRISQPQRVTVREEQAEIERIPATAQQ